MNLSQLEILVAIVETGSLTEAAATVNVTQSAVSHALSKLEAELGVTLLERGRQGVTVTRIGEDVLQHARAILGQVDVIRQKVAQERDIAVGKVRFGCVRSIAPRLLTGILRAFQTQYPDIDLVFFEGTPKEILGWLASGVVDVGTVLMPSVVDHAVPLAKGEIKAVVSVTHPFAGRSSVTLPELLDEPLVGPKSEYQIFNTILGDMNVKLPRVRYEVSDHQTILTMVREGMGISLMPNMVISFDDSIVSLPLDPPLYTHVFLGSNGDSPAVQAFMTTAHTWAKGNGFLPVKS